MSIPTYIHNIRLIRPGQPIAGGTVLIADGVIRELDGPEPAVGNSLDGEGGFLTPGLIDLHTHGIGSFLYERSPEDILGAAALLPSFGTTCVLPTLYRVLDRDSFSHLNRLAATLESVCGARMPGFHLEGPFLALPGAGAQCIPSDVNLLNDLLAACRGKVRAMSISPDTPNILPVIERLAAANVLPLITHTRASVEQTQRAIDAGAVHATHFYDVFPLPAETEPGVRPCGVVETMLADPRCSVDFIADGVHVHPTAIRAAMAAKGFEKVLLITDSNLGAGLQEGVYETPWGFSVRVKAGDGARIADSNHPLHGGLAGSALTMDAGIRNLRHWLNVPPEQVFAMGTLNVARLLGLDRLGRLQTDAAADLVLWDGDLAVCKTWVAGELVFERQPKN